VLVKEILKGKGDEVFTVSPDVTVQDAARLLHERRVGALVVLDAGGRVAGILSERDLVRTVAEAGPDALARPVRSCMTADVIYARPSETADELLGRMTDRRIRHLPVCENDRLLGVLSIGDLVKVKIKETEAEAEGLKAYIAAG
jgi:CBS domain-containing protein